MSDGGPFCISFDADERPGEIVVVTVALGKDVLGPNDMARIDLCDHPLYPTLARYVADNPPRRRRKHRPH